MALETFPSILLVVMVTITLILLPRLNDEAAVEPEKATRPRQKALIRAGNSSETPTGSHQKLH
jgi:hypothetical protein